MAKVKFEFDKNELNMLYYLIKNDKIKFEIYLFLTN